MRDRVYHVAGEHHAQRRIALTRSGPDVRAVGIGIDPVGVGRIGRSARRVVVQRARDRGRTGIVDHGQPGGIQPPAYAGDLNPALRGQVGDQNPFAVRRSRQGLHPGADRQHAVDVVVEAGAAAHVDPFGDVHPVDIGGCRGAILCQDHLVQIVPGHPSHQHHQDYPQPVTTANTQHRHSQPQQRTMPVILPRACGSNQFTNNTTIKAASSQNQPGRRRLRRSNART